MSQDWLFFKDNTVCDVRTAGVLLRDGKLLVQRDADGDVYALPGGHIRIGETLAQGLVREFWEETGAAICCGKLLWSEECFWEWNGRKAHNLAFYHLVTLASGSDIPDTGEFVPHKDNGSVVLTWMEVKELEKVTIYPAFLKEEIFKLDGPMKHFVTIE